jgi:hypothetical protein
VYAHLPDSIARSFHVSASGKGYRDVHVAVDLDAIELPHDLGVVEVERAPALEVRVVDRSGAPVEGALVWTQEGSSCTDRNGSARVEFEVGTKLLVLAPGYSLASVTPTEPDGPVELTLEPGLAVEVLASSGEGTVLDAGVRLKLSWDRTPFEGAGPGQPRPWGVHDAYERMQASQSGLFVRGGGNYDDPDMPAYHVAALPPDGRMVVPGLLMGAELRLGLVDCFQRLLVERSVRLQDTPGVQTVALEASSPGIAQLIVTMDGDPLTEGSVLVRPSGSGNGTSFPIRDGRAELGPMVAGTYDLEVAIQGRPTGRIEACELVPGAPPLEIELEP